MKKHTFLLLFIITTNIFSQNTDSLYNLFISVMQPLQTEGIKITWENENENEKCLTGLINEVKNNLNLFNPKQKMVLNSLLQRPVADTSVVTLSGRFRIHFNKSGNDKPGYDVDELAAAFDSSYNYEVNILGYPPPPFDNGEGGDNKYDIYLKNLPTSFYGYTETENQITDKTYITFIVMDNDFSSTYTKGIDAARVTAAHELHHAIQMGNYVYRQNDLFYFEATSTAMEEFVYDSINDYYAYMKSFTDRPYRTFSANSGYNLAAWNIFLKDRFGIDVIKRIWELMPNQRTLDAAASAISENGSTFKTEFNIFGQWFYFTGNRAIPNKYFEEAANYTQISPLMSAAFTQPEASITIDSEPVSLNYLLFTSGTSIPDSFYSIVANCDITNGINNITSKLNFTYHLSNNQGDGYTKIIDGYFSKIESISPFLLTESNILNNIALNDGGINTTEIDYPFPQPFHYSINSNINFPVGITYSGYADLYIYSIDMNLVFNGQVRIVTSDKIYAQWNGLDENSNRLNTGIYFYVVKVGDETKKGKFAVFND